MLSINTNIASLFGASNFNRTSAEVDSITKQLASGKRILSAADDPAALGIVSNLRTERMSYEAVSKNIKSGLSLLNVAETSLAGQQDILTEMKNLATQAASDLLTADQRSAVQAQFAELQSQLDNIVNEATLFGQNLTGAGAADVEIQTGIRAGSRFTLTAATSDAATLGVDAGTIDLTTSAGAVTAMTAIDTAVGNVAVAQSTMGAQQTGLEALSRIAENTQTNVSAAISRIEDADIPKLSIELAQAQTKLQLQTQMLGIMNQMPQFLVGLLR